MKKIIKIIFIIMFLSNCYSQSRFDSIIIKDSDGDEADVISNNGYNGLVTISTGHISTDNSTSTPLSGGATFTGTWEDISNFGVIVVTVYADQASATDGLDVEFSSDGTNIDSSDMFTIPADTGKTFSFQCPTQYFRVKYTNGGSAQSAFRLQTVLKPYYVKPSSHRIQDSITDEDDAELVKAIISGKDAGGTYVNFQATTAGNFKVSVEEADNQASPVYNYITDDGVGTIVNVEQASDDSTDLEDKYGLVANSILNARISNTAIRPLRADSSTHTLQVIDYEHHEIHGGSTFRVQHNQDNIPAVGSNGCLVIAFYVPDQAKEPHMLWETSHEGNMTVTLYEGVTLNASAGSDRAVKQSNRNSANTSILQSYASGALLSNEVAVGENSVDNIYSGGSIISLKRDYSTKNTAGGQSRRNEVILKTNTNYAFCLSNNESTTQGGQIRLEWYEHTPKN